MKKIYDKSKITFTIILIVLYCVLMSSGDNLSLLIGIDKIITLPISLVLSLIIIIFLSKNKLLKEYGICKGKIPYKKVLYYFPLVVLITTNLWYGVSINYNAVETILYILTMLCVGFLEEIIFRGFLFNTMKKDNLKVAIIVSSLTFGIGHIINLFNGSGAELLSNLLQVIYATSAGFMFVMLYHRTNSLLPCIITHGVFNALSAFTNQNLSLGTNIISCIVLMLITGSYALYLTFCINDKK